MVAAAGLSERLRSSLLGSIQTGWLVPGGVDPVPLGPSWAASEAPGPQRGGVQGRTPRLDQGELKGSEEGKEGRTGRKWTGLVVKGCKCKSWVCPKCGVGFWGHWRAKVMPHLAVFRQPILVTLTLSREWFADGYTAWRKVEGAGYVRRLLRLLGFKTWFKVLAFHPGVDEKGREGREWPHWHIVVDMADVGGWVDLRRAHRLWRKWGLGRVIDFGLKFRNVPAERAVGYAVRYCQHQAGVLPSWIMGMERAPRCVEVAGLLREKIAEANPARVVQAPASGVVEDEGKSDRGRERRCSTVAERLAKCRVGGSELVRESVYPDGQRYAKWWGSLPVTPGQLVMLKNLGLIEGLRVERLEDDRSSDLRVLVECEVGREREAIQRLADQVQAALRVVDRSSMAADEWGVLCLDDLGSEAFGDEGPLEDDGEVLGDVPF